MNKNNNNNKNIGVTSISAPFRQEASHVGAARVEVVSLRGAPLTIVSPLSMVVTPTEPTNFPYF